MSAVAESGVVCEKKEKKEKVKEEKVPIVIDLFLVC